MGGLLCGYNTTRRLPTGFLQPYHAGTFSDNTPSVEVVEGLTDLGARYTAGSSLASQTLIP